MLLKIFEGSELPKLLIIKDSTAVKDGSYFLSCVSSRCKQDFSVHCFLWDYSQLEFNTVMNPISPYDSNIIVHELHSDPFHWNSKDTHIDELNSEWEAVPGKKGIVVAMDSHKIFRNNRTAMFKWLIHMKNQLNIAQIILMVHEDLLTPEENVVIDYLSDASIMISNEYLLVEKLRMKSATKRNDGRPDIPIAKVLLKRSTGKIVNTLESYHISRTFSLHAEPWVFEEPTTNKVDDEKDESSDLPKDVTFKLSLSKAEQKQRDKLVMPYTPAHKMDIKIENDANENKAQIFYEPDEDDDFDDEDPDDDLEF